MTETITPSTDVDRLARRLHQRESPSGLRRSNHREQDLERYAVTMADGQELRLDLDPEKGNPARVKMRRKIPHIYIPAWELPQLVTNFDRKPFDYLMQKALTIHELGHVLFTEQSAVDDALEQVSSKHQEFFHNIWNALEDGAIEEELRREFNVAGDLAVANANFGAAGADGVTEYGMTDAIITGCLDLAVYDSGRLEALIDSDDMTVQFNNDRDRKKFTSEVLPELRDAAADVVGESDPETRTDRILELWEKLVNILDLDDLDDPQINNGGKGDHADQESGSGESADNLDDLDSDSLQDFVDEIASDSSDSGADTDGTDKDGTRNQTETRTGKETNSGAETASDSDSSDEKSGHDSLQKSPDSDTDSDVDAKGSDTEDSPDADTVDDSSQYRGANGTNTSGDAGPTDEQAEDEDAGKSSDKRPQRQPDQEQQVVQEDDHSVSEDIIDNYERRVQEQQTETSEAVEEFQDEFEELKRALERIEEDHGQPTELQVTSPATPRTDAWRDAQRTGNRLKRILNQRLQEEERGRMRRRIQSGRIDSRSLPRLKQRDLRVFRKREDPDEKDYSVVLILDRSGSMGNDIQRTEEACAALSYALNALDIESSVMDVSGRTPKLAKPFGVDPENCLDTLLTGETGGSTPLSPALRIARERLEDRDEFPFVIILTDGKPDRRKEYKNELSRCRFPVLGVYINFGGSSDPANVNQSAEYFDERRIVTDRNKLSDELRNLCQSVMF